MVPGSRSTRTERGTYLLFEAWHEVRLGKTFEQLTNLIEVDVHALELKIRGAIVAACCQIYDR